jgi:hypothetical protein
MYGDSNNHTQKYHPVRYHWINLFSILKKGSLEFRIFNTSTNPYDIRAIILLCQAMTNTMLKTNYKDLKALEVNPYNSIFYPENKSSENVLDYILENYECKYPTLKYKLYDIYNKSEFPKIENKPVFSQMIEKEDIVYFTNTDYCPEAISREYISGPKYEDIHNNFVEGAMRNVPINLNKYIK